MIMDNRPIWQTYAMTRDQVARCEGVAFPSRQEVEEERRRIHRQEMRSWRERKRREKLIAREELPTL